MPRLSRIQKPRTSGGGSEMVGALEEDGRRVESGWKEDGKEEGQKKRRIGKGGLEGEDGNKTEEGEVLIREEQIIISSE